MRRFVLIAAAVAVVALALFAAAQSANTQANHTYSIVNNLQRDQSMSSGTPSVSCDSNLFETALRVRCSSQSSWTTVAVATQSPLVCPVTDSAIHWRNAVADTAAAVTYRTIDWSCSLNAEGVSSSAARSVQKVTFSGTLSMCTGTTITASPICNYYSAEGTVKPG